MLHAAIDLGLTSPSGHHYSIACNLKEYFRNKKTELFYVRGGRSEDRTSQHRQQSFLDDMPMANTDDFYYVRTSSRELNKEETVEFIFGYSRAFEDALSLVAQQRNEGGCVVLYPCLGIEHVYALLLALERIPEALEINHHLIVQYPIAPDEQELQWDAEVASAVKSIPLLRHNSVKVYATDHEQAMSLNRDIGLHRASIAPVLFIDTETENRGQSKIFGGDSYYILYLGDARIEKGFFKLAKLIEDLKPDYNYVIQYTNTTSETAQWEAEADLLFATKNYPNVEVIRGFLDEPELHHLVENSAGFICTYDPVENFIKPSGIAYLFAIYNKPILTTGDCWITREVKRLGGSALIDQDLNSNNCPIPISEPRTNNGYYKALFESKSDFLDSLFKQA